MSVVLEFKLLDLVSKPMAKVTNVLEKTKASLGGLNKLTSQNTRSNQKNAQSINGLSEKLAYLQKRRDAAFSVAKIHPSTNGRGAKSSV